MGNSSSFGCSNLSWFFFIPAVAACVFALFSTIIIFIVTIYKFYFVRSSRSSARNPHQRSRQKQSSARKITSTAQSPSLTYDTTANNTPEMRSVPVAVSDRNHGINNNSSPDLITTNQMRMEKINTTRPSRKDLRLTMASCSSQSTPDPDSDHKEKETKKEKEKEKEKCKRKTRHDKHNGNIKSKSQEEHGLRGVDPLLKAACVIALGMFCIHSISVFVIFIIDALCPETVKKYYDAYDEVGNINNSNGINNEMFVHNFFQQILNWTHFLPLSLEFIIFSYRLIMAFGGTILEISKIKKRLLFVVGILLLLIIPVFRVCTEIIFRNPQSSDELKLKYEWIIYGTILWIINYISGFIIAVYIFKSQVELCTVTIFQHHKENQRALLNMTTKLFCCVSISCLSTILNGFFYTFASLTGNIMDYNNNDNNNNNNDDGSTSKTTLMITLLLSVTIEFDFLINCLCLALQWPGFNESYYRYCKICHKLVKLLSTRRGNNINNINDNDNDKQKPRPSPLSLSAGQLPKAKLTSRPVSLPLLRLDTGATSTSTSKTATNTSKFNRTHSVGSHDHDREIKRTRVHTLSSAELEIKKLKMDSNGDLSHTILGISDHEDNSNISINININRNVEICPSYTSSPNVTMEDTQPSSVEISQTPNVTFTTAVAAVTAMGTSALANGEVFEPRKARIRMNINSHGSIPEDETARPSTPADQSVRL